MPSFIDFFNPTFFIFLGMLVLVAALLIVYFETKLREQNHKITSMFSLVTAITDELNTVKHIALSGGVRVHHDLAPPEPVNQVLSETIDLIEVSDDDDEDTENDDSSEEEDESDSDAESDSDSVQEECDIIEIGELETSNIKILKVNMTSQSPLWETSFDRVDGEIEFDHSLETESESAESSFEQEDDDLCDEEAELELKTEFNVLEVKLEMQPESKIEIENEALLEDEIHLPKQIDFDLKSINISNLEIMRPLGDSSIQLKKDFREHIHEAYKSLVN